MFLLSTSTESQENIWRMLKGTVLWLSWCVERSQCIFHNKAKYIKSLNRHMSEKNNSIIEKLTSFRFKTTYLDVSHALNHKKAMIHITFKSFCNDFQKSVIRHPKLKFWVEKTPQGTDKIIMKTIKKCCAKSYSQIIFLTELQDWKDKH